LVEFAIKTFPSIKPAIIGGDALPSQTAPLLPYLKGLPLRPKIALASGYVPPSQGPGALRGNPVAVGGAPGLAPSKLAPGNTQATRVPLPKTPAPSANLPQRASGKDSDPRTQGALAPASAPDGATKQPAQVDTPQAISGAQQTKPEVPKPQPAASVAALVETSLAQPGASGLALKAPLSPVTTATAGDSASPATEPDPNAATEPNAAAEPDKDDAAKKDTVPSFSAAQPANIPWLGSLKLKLGLAIALVVIACVYFLGWGGGRAGKPGGLNSGVSADSSGPSIILGEGGWVEDWGGDPTGVHAGRQITIYRPSLKLSDYRLEFQGNIDAKSLGWVFRAADPDNYYAMKLMIVSSGLSTKVALFKYLVANGKQIQVGRVPIDLAVLPDTVFNVRVDVRGPQFTTYVQGRQVDTWTDDQLKTGGTGFLNEREERGKVKSVSIRYLSGTAN